MASVLPKVSLVCFCIQHTMALEKMGGKSLKIVCISHKLFEDKFYHMLISWSIIACLNYLAYDWFSSANGKYTFLKCHNCYCWHKSGWRSAVDTLSHTHSVLLQSHRSLFKNHLTNSSGKERDKEKNRRNKDGTRDKLRR